MSKDQDHADFVERFTGFAMRQASRRGFFKWLGKTGLALAVGTTGSVEFLRQMVFAMPESVPCYYYLPGCTGGCYCNESCCQDLDNGAVFCCHGNCCGCDSVWVFVDVYWFWNGSRCVQTYECVPCTP